MKLKSLLLICLSLNLIACNSGSSSAGNQNLASGNWHIKFDPDIMNVSCNGVGESSTNSYTMVIQPNTYITDTYAPNQQITPQYEVFNGQFNSPLTSDCFSGNIGNINGQVNTTFNCSALGQPTTTIKFIGCYNSEVNFVYQLTGYYQMKAQNGTFVTGKFIGTNGG